MPLSCRAGWAIVAMECHGDVAVVFLPRRAGAATCRPPRPPVNPTILIVDDEKHTREGLRASLEDSFEVYIAADIGGAMSVLEREQVDLMLTDLRLAGRMAWSWSRRHWPCPTRPSSS